MTAQKPYQIPVDSKSHLWNSQLMKAVNIMSSCNTQNQRDKIRPGRRLISPSFSNRTEKHMSPLPQQEEIAKSVTAVQSYYG